MSASAKLPAFFARSAPERQLLLEVFLVLALVRMGLSLLPYGVLLRLVRRSVAKKPNAELVQVTRALKSASCYVPRATCLTQALAGRRLLAAHGYSSRLRVGVRKDGGRLKAHAWLEHRDIVVIGRVSNLADYRPLPNEGGQP